MNKLHNFFVIGAQRSGTTYLYKMLDAHPEIEMAKPMYPEPKYFLDNAQEKFSLERYSDLFFTKESSVYRGEKGTSYIESEKAAQRIAKCVPHAKIIITLREPVSRAISNYWFSRKNGFETLSIREAFAKEEERLEVYDASKVSASPYAYLKRGYYLEYIKKYQQYFSDDQIKVVVFEQLVSNPAVLREVYDFIGATAEFEPDLLLTQHNRGDYDTDDLGTDEIKQLKAQYKIPNQLLAKRFNLDLSHWA